MAEQGQARRQRGRAVTQVVERLGVPDMRRIGWNRRDQSAPQLGLPVQVGFQIAQISGQPVDQQPGTLPGIGGEQTRQAASERIAPAPAQVSLVPNVEVSQMFCQGAAPRLGH